MVRRPLTALFVAGVGLLGPAFAQETPPAANEPIAGPTFELPGGQEPTPAPSAAAAPAAPVIDRSDWPVLDTLVIDAAAIDRAQAVAADRALAPIVIDDVELRRTLVYMIGAKELKSYRLDVDIQAETERQLAAGRDPAELAISDEEIQKTIDQTMEQIRVQYPTLDPADVLRVNNIHLGNLARMTRQTRLFTKVFLPDDPNKWPQLSVEALRATGQNQIVDQFQQSFARINAQLAAGEITPEEAEQARTNQGMLRQMLSQMVIQALDKAAKVESIADGLPSHVAMRVNGIDVLTDVVFDEIASRVTARDVELARLWLAKCALLERVLAERGFLLSPSAAKAAFAEHMAPMQGTMFPPEFFVMQVKGFPSMDLYAQHHRLLASFEKMIASEITEEALAKHFAERGNELLNVARVGVEVILLSAYDFAKGQWKQDGWADAERRAREVAQKLLEGQGANWSELQDQYSDYWDPPAPTSGAQGQQPRRKNKGRFAPMARNEMLGEMGENEFTLFIDGSSVTDEFFFFTAQGSISDVFKGRHGYYIGRVTTRTAPQGARGLDDVDMRSMVVQDYVNQRFNEFTHDVYVAASAK
jgi:hypothetical protein